MAMEITVVGGGLAGSEAAWQAANRGLEVTIFEMRPGVNTAAHETAGLAELVCSNSLGSNLIDRASGLLKQELRLLDSMLIACADESAVPAGGALAVDRNRFSSLVTQKILSHPNIKLVREEVKTLPDGPAIIASGPLTSTKLTESIIDFSGYENLFFFDAIAPLVAIESVNMEIAYRASRYGRGTQIEGDYINCPLNQIEYQNFVEALVDAERISLNETELILQDGSGVVAGSKQFFEGCLPVEVLASRDQKSLAFGPLRPVGLNDPRTGKRPYAVVQMRQDNLAGTIYNLVGFQTNLKFSEQKRVLRMIPGLENAEFLRFGQMHRNTFIFSPDLLRQTMESKQKPGLFFAGQITGIEGYAGNIASGLVAGRNIANFIDGKELEIFPIETMIGALCTYITHASPQDFQPMKANYGILPPLDDSIKRNKRQRAAEYSSRALEKLQDFLTG
jgi:methylenetetrahydrofolate--tRNA-(uracil-5-)-methyltransferase